MADERNPPLIHREGGPAPRPQEAPPEPAHDDEYRWHTGEHRADRRATRRSSSSTCTRRSAATRSSAG